MENLLSVHDVAAIMRVHHKKVQRLARTGVLPCIKIGCVYRFQPEALKGWIDNEVSKRVPEKEDTQGRLSDMGVSLPECVRRTEAEDIAVIRTALRGVSKGGPTESSF